jgi:hypothetical protein
LKNRSTIEYIKTNNNRGHPIKIRITLAKETTKQIAARDLIANRLVRTPVNATNKKTVIARNNQLTRLVRIPAGTNPDPQKLVE